MGNICQSEGATRDLLVGGVNALARSANGNGGGNGGKLDLSALFQNVAAAAVQKATNRGANLFYKPATRAFVEEAAQAVKADVFMVSGCKDDQTSADVMDVSSFGLPPVNPAEKAGGACTNSVLKVLKANPNQSYGQLITNINGELRQRGYTQIPQLSSGQQIDLNATAFSWRNPKNPKGPTKSLLIGINYIGDSQAVVALTMSA